MPRLTGFIGVDPSDRMDVMAKPTDVLDFLAHPAKHPVPATCVLFGDESFLKREAILLVQEQVVSGDDADFSITSYQGRDTTLRDVLDALSSRALFGAGRRMVVVEDADEFVSQNR